MIMPLMDRILHYWSMSQMTCPSGRQRFTLVSSQNSTNPFLLERTYQYHTLSAVVKTECLPKGFSIHRVSQKKHIFMGQDDLPEFKNVRNKILIIYRFDSEGFSSQIPQPASMFLHSFRLGFSAVIRNMIFSKAGVTSKCPEDHWKLLSSKVASFHSFRKLIFVNPIFEREAINHDKSV